MVKYVKIQLVLPEDLEAIGIFLGSVSFAEIGNMGLCLFIEGEGGIFVFGLGGGDEEEFSYFWAGLNDSVDIFRSDLVIAEIVEDCNGGVDVIAVLSFEGWEELSFVFEIFLFKHVTELFVAHCFGLFRDNIFAVVHYF